MAPKNRPSIRTHARDGRRPSVCERSPKRAFLVQTQTGDEGRGFLGDWDAYELPVHWGKGVICGMCQLSLIRGRWRVELRSSKREELERAAKAAEPSSVDLQKRKLLNQTVGLEGGMKVQMEKARQRDVRKVCARWRTILIRSSS